jgi:hypothetical protein
MTQLRVHAHMGGVKLPSIGTHGSLQHPSLAPTRGTFCCYNDTTLAVSAICAPNILPTPQFSHNLCPGSERMCGVLDGKKLLLSSRLQHPSLASTPVTYCLLLQHHNCHTRPSFANLQQPACTSAYGHGLSHESERMWGV